MLNKLRSERGKQKPVSQITSAKKKKNHRIPGEDSFVEKSK